LNGYLLDTNALLWLALDHTSLRAGARRTLMDAPLFVSVISAVEIAIKASIGKLVLPDPFSIDFNVAFATMLDREAVDVIPLELSTIGRLRSLPLHHRDLFDRIIIAQSLEHGLTVATRDHAFLVYEGLDVLEV
jgi:PIN domain nuclease of toxin-antitoxin system